MTLEHPDAGRVEIGGEPLFTMTRGGREVPVEDPIPVWRAAFGDWAGHWPAPLRNYFTRGGVAKV